MHFLARLRNHAKVGWHAIKLLELFYESIAERLHIFRYILRHCTSPIL